MKLMQRLLTITLFLIFGINYAQENDANKISKEPLQVNDTLIKADALAENKILDSVKTDSIAIPENGIALIDHAEVSEFDKKWLEVWRNNVLDSSLIINPQDTIGKIVIDSFSTDVLKERIAFLDS